MQLTYLKNISHLIGKIYIRWSSFFLKNGVYFAIVVEGSECFLVNYLTNLNDILRE